uniref:Uncharacterized protein n=1 Tax=Oryza glumipatula TaxID=40148 RepID=A0A0D9ZGJ3_9ORYZ
MILVKYNIFHIDQ